MFDLNFLPKINDNALYALPKLDDSIIFGNSRDKIAAHLASALHCYKYDKWCDIVRAWHSSSENWFLVHIEKFVGWELQTKDGKFIKRLDKWLKKTVDLKLTDSQKGEIGGLLQNQNGEHSYFSLLSNSNASARSYYHGGSCWWNEYEYNKDVFLDGGGFAVLFYDENKELNGRIWGYSADDDNLILFNYYGKSTHVHTVARLARLLFAQTKKINLYCDEDALYLNGDNSVIYFKNHEDYYSLDESFYFETYNCSCYECGERMHDDDAYVSNDGYTFCEYCYDRYCTQCENCGETYYESDNISTTDDNVNLCSHCMDYNTTYCEHCGGTYYNRETYRTIDDGIVCSDCYDDLERCENCDAVFLDERELTDGLCENCYEEKEKQNENEY